MLRQAQEFVLSYFTVMCEKGEVKENLFLALKLGGSHLG